MSTQKKARVNREIDVNEVRLIDAEGEQVGVVAIDKALEMARDVSLDLVEVSPNVKPPVCKILDFGKYRFSQSKKNAAQKKKQKQVQVKEMKFRPGTDIGDYNVKLKKVSAFLERGDKVKISLRFRGREMQHKELGMELMQRIKVDLDELSMVEQEPKYEGRQMLMVLAPKKS